MSTDAPAAIAVVYPASDGKPLADNTLQWDWIVKIVGELREQFAGKEVFVASDLRWFPVEGDPKTVTAPDVMVAFDRPSVYRDSYKQWDEAGVAPQVVFEVLSPNNTREEMAEKLKFYEAHGVEEYYLLNLRKHTALGWVRADGRFQIVNPIGGFVSPKLGIRFEENGELKLFTPDGREFMTREERVAEILEDVRKTANAFEDVRKRAMEAIRQLTEERAEKDVLLGKLRDLGLDPDSVLRHAA